MVISIIVPIYNVEKYLTQCLDSIVSQTYSDIEIILIDDGSTDSSFEISENYAKKDSRIKLIHKENGGLVSAWKEGLRHSTGEFICFIDSDDFVTSDYVESMVKHVKDDIDLVCMNCTKYINSANQTPLHINALPAGEHCLDKEFYDNFIIGPWEDKAVANSRCAKLIRSSIVKKYAQCCSERVTFGEDQQLTIGVLLGCKKIVVTDEYKYYYRSNPTSIVHSYKKDLWQRSKLLIKTVNDIPEIDQIENINVQLKLQLLEYLYECLKNEQFYGGGLKRKYFRQLVEEAISLKLFEKADKKLPGKLSRLLFPFVSRNCYLLTKAVLNFYKFIRRV